MTTATAVFPWLESWKLAVQGWSRDGSLVRAAQDALNLDAVPPALQRLIAQWSDAQWDELPPIEVLSSEAMPGAAGAYAISTATIYMNQSWLESASPQQVQAVLTEELGHHLDGLLNTADTAGDEGHRFAQHVLGGSAAERTNTDNQIEIQLKGRVLTAEAAERPFPPSRPELVDGSESEVSNSYNVSNTNRPTFRGTAEPASKIELFANGISIGSTISDESGLWRYSVADSSALSDGSYEVTAVAANENVVSTLQRHPIAIAVPGRTHQEYRNDFAFAALKSDGSVVAWGRDWAGGDSTAVSAELESGVIQIFSTSTAFAALKEDGSVITWGSSSAGGDSSWVASELQSGVTQIYSNANAFAALREDGSVIAWGWGFYGGDSSGVSAELRSDVTQVFSSRGAFAALKRDGSVVSWGSTYDGGDNSGVANVLQSGVIQITSTDWGAFAALKDDGSVVTWGTTSTSSGGDSSSVSSKLQSDVKQVFSTKSAFAALKNDGSVITWGAPNYGGDSSVSSYDADGNPNYKSISNELQVGVTQIYSTGYAFAALKDDGSVVSWGRSDWGGDSSAVANQLKSDVIQVFSTDGAFAALKSDGSVVTWGYNSDEEASHEYGGDSSSVSGQLNSGVVEVLSNAYAFAAIKTDGSVITWGDSLSGGDSSSVASDLHSGVQQIYATRGAFAAIKADGSVITWGDTAYGGDSSSVASQLQSGVVSFADPFHDDRLISASSGSGLSSEPSPALAITIDTTAPLFTSDSNTGFVDENSGSGQVVYTAVATDTSDITYRLKLDNSDDSESFAIDPTTGEVQLTADPDYEGQASYAFTVVATDAAGNTAEQEVTLAINDLDENAPVFVSSAVASAINENTGAEQVIYTAAVTDESSIAYSLRPDAGDAPAFSIDELSGAVTLLANPDYESKPSYAFTVVATDAAGNTAEQEVTLAINDLPEIVLNHAPSGALLLSGIPRPGITISLDGSTIADEDGVDSFFSYGWQVLDNNLGAWVDINTEDAIDGDADLLLTSELVGQELRGRASYVDGNGLTEVIASAAVTIQTPLSIDPEGPKTQTVYTALDTIPYAPGADLEIPLLYDTGNHDSNLSGLTLNVHFDSSVLTPIGNGVSNRWDAAITSATVFDDSLNLDSNPLTDKLIELSWESFDSSFPGAALPASIATLQFQTSQEKLDPITGENLQTALNTTASFTASGFEFVPHSTLLEATPFSLDVDADGLVSPLADGLMVIRKLFGNAFAGEALTHKAQGPNSPWSTEQVHDFIELGINSGVLDVDRDGRTTALGDGLMVIRRLFGAAFTGEALINKAISPDSPYYGEDNAWELVAANIDALIP